MKSPFVGALAGTLMVVLAAACAAAPADPAAPPAVASPAPTADELRASMLESDSILVARVDVEILPGADSTGAPKTTWKTKRVSVNQVKSPWMKRFVANLLPEGAQVHDELCPTPQPTAGSLKPWMVTALWINKTGRGQAYLDFSSRCGFAGLAGRTPQGFEIGAHADSLFALFQEALYADSTLKTMKLGAPSMPAAAVPAREPDGKLHLEDNVGVAKPPEPLTKVAPAYPKAASAAGVEGTVVVIALVDKDGHVADAQVQEGVGLLNFAALTAVRKWTFKPASKADGSPVEARVLVPVEFKLKPGEGKPAK